MVKGAMLCEVRQGAARRGIIREVRALCFFRRIGETLNWAFPLLFPGIYTSWACCKTVVCPFFPPLFLPFFLFGSKNSTDASNAGTLGVCCIILQSVCGKRDSFLFVWGRTREDTSN